MPFPDRLVGIQEICELTGKQPRTVRGWFAKRRLRRVKFEGVTGVWESELLAALGWRGLSEPHDAADAEPADPDDEGFAP
jgi:hypothetical protein